MSFLQLKGLGKRFGPHDPPALEAVTLSVEQGEILALLGPSGCGKTTTLRLIAGFERPDAGRVEIGGQVLVDSSTFVPPEARGVGMVFQDLALFPHLTVAANVGFGLRRLAAKTRTRRVQEMLTLVGLASLAHRYPHELSSGQQQRVALARALAPCPSVLLLDEPFSNLDASLRLQMLHEVHSILRDLKMTAIFVTHDQEEAFMMADRVGILRQGRLEQLGTPEEIYHFPNTRFVAGFVGRANFLAGLVTTAGIETALGMLPNTPGLPLHTEVDVMLRPDHLQLVPDPQGEARVVARHFCGPYSLLAVQLPSQLVLQAYQPTTTLLHVGDAVRVRAHPAHVVAFLRQGAPLTRPGRAQE